MEAATVQRAKETGPLPLALSVAVAAVFAVRFTGLSYDGGEFLRACSFDCDNARGGLIATELLVLPFLIPISGLAAWLIGRPHSPLVRRWMAMIESANGALAIMALGSTLIVASLAPLLLPLSATGFAASFALARQVAPTTPTHWSDDPALTTRFWSYVTVGLLMAWLLVAGFVTLKRGGSCQIRDIDGWHNCTRDGNLFTALGWLALWTITTGAAMDWFDRRLRAGDPRRGWLLASSVGASFSIALVASHLLG